MRQVRQKMEIEQVDHPRFIRKPGGPVYLQLRVDSTRIEKMDPLAVARLQRVINNAAFLIQRELAAYPAYGDEFLNLLVAQASEPLPPVGVIPDRERGQIVYAYQFADQLPVAVRLDAEIAAEQARNTLVKIQRMAN